MPPVTREQLADACMKLADECEGPNPPKLGKGMPFDDNGPCCAFGHALSRIGVTGKDIGFTFFNDTALRRLKLNDNDGNAIAIAASRLARFNDEAPSRERAHVDAPLLRDLPRPLRGQRCAHRSPPPSWPRSP